MPAPTVPLSITRFLPLKRRNLGYSRRFQGKLVASSWPAWPIPVRSAAGEALRELVLGGHAAEPRRTVSSQ